MSANAQDAPKIVLVVDDEAPILALMKARVEIEGFQVVTSFEVSHAIMALQNLTPDQSNRIVAVLLDVGLRDMPGETVLKSLKKIHPALPVIMVTGLHDETKARELVRLGAMDYITKPVDFNQLIETLHNIASD